MQWLISGLIYVTGCIIIYQDLTSRSVSWVVFPLLIVLGIFLNLTCGLTLGVLFTNTVINACFLGFQFFFLWIYFYVKKKATGFYNKIGPGDILFLLACCFFFSPLNFLFFYILSLVFSLCMFLLFHGPITRQKKVTSVPLAGLQSLFLLCFITINHLLQNNVTTDAWLLNRIFFYDI